MNATKCLLVTCIAFCVYWLYKKFFRLIYLGSKFNGPTAYPLIGTAYLFFNKAAVDYRKIILELAKKYNTNVRLWFGHNLVIVLANPEDIKTVLLADATGVTVKAEEYRFLKACTGSGLVTSDGKIWSSHSKVILPAFNNNMLESYLKIIHKQVDSFMEVIVRRENGEYFDIHDDFLKFTLDVLTTTCMGVYMNFLNGENEDYYNASHRLNKSIAERIFDMSLRFDFAYQFSKKFQQWESDQKLSNNFCHKVIRERRNKLVKSDVDEKVFLDILLEARIDGIPLTNEEICGEVLTFLEAGHTTTAVSISFLLFKMAQYPEVERKLVEEIDSVIGDSNDPIPMETLKEFKYMDLVLQETHRLYPPVPNIARRVLKDFKLSEHIVPAGATIAISQLCLGRRPELFENPEEFIPERFIDKEFHNFAYLPFSAGQRHCIGFRFANMVMKLFLCNFLRRYTVKIEENFEPEFVISMAIAPENGMRMKITRRV